MPPRDCDRMGNSDRVARAKSNLSVAGFLRMFKWIWFHRRFKLGKVYRGMDSMDSTIAIANVLSCRKEFSKIFLMLRKPAYAIAS